ncbi:DUF805 domain-containing protein, partial [Aeromonas jandaei]
VFGVMGISNADKEFVVKVRSTCSHLPKQLDYGYKLMGVYGLFIIVPCWALSVRRLHDIGRNGWFLLLGLIPIIGPLMVIFFKAKRGNPYSNRYGAIPFI